MGEYLRPLKSQSTSATFAVGYQPAARQALRPEIQALRAIAVLLVVVYHLWPRAVTGGYAGVDVFFVISGFLITRHLASEAERTGTVNLLAFWARRVRRLLPASLLIILFSAAATLLVVPRVYLSQYSKEMLGAIGYVINWVLAKDSVDYLAADNNASPVQHYWSLSVEEQFYLVWPILIVGALIVGRRWVGRVTLRQIMVALLVAVTAVSFVLSVVLTDANASSVYFVTHTRVWEFGIGGILGLLIAERYSQSRARAIVGWVGVLGLMVVGLTYSASTPFPGYTAALPVAATAAVIWAGSSRLKWSSASMAKLVPLQFVGDISYSFYLWHWPLIVLFPYTIGRDMNSMDAVGVLLASIVLAWLTKKYVEDPFRKPRSAALKNSRFTLALLVPAMGIAAILPVTGFMTARADVAASAKSVQMTLAESPGCFGAAAMVNPGCEDAGTGRPLLPRLAALKDDTGIAFDCYVKPPITSLETCPMGSTKTDALNVAIVGDSHAAMLIPGLASHLEKLNWQLDPYVVRGCRWRSIEASPGNAEPAAGQPDESCAGYRSALQERLENGPRYDLVLVTGSRGESTTHAQASALASDQATVWKPVLARGTKVVAISDNPRVPQELSACVSEAAARGEDARSCSPDRLTALSPVDSLPLTVERAPGAKLLDLTDLYCSEMSCPMVIGDAIVYVDAHHLTATYSQTVAPILIERLRAIIG